jgi:hypothetical protein
MGWTGQTRSTASATELLSNEKVLVPQDSSSFLDISTSILRQQSFILASAKRQLVPNVLFRLVLVSFIWMVLVGSFLLGVLHATFTIEDKSRRLLIISALLTILVFSFRILYVIRDR